MPVTISGMSGIETDGMIQKLVEVESRPIRQLEIRKKNLNLRKEGLRNLGKTLEDVNSAAKDLYGIRASFYDKNASSSDKSVVDAKADKNAEQGVKKIKVIQVASVHKISSDPVQENDNLPSGKFTIEVNGEKATVNFNGGRLKNLKEKIDDSASGIVTASYIKKSGDAYILTIQSNKTGEKGEIKISGDKDVLKKIGLIDGEKSDKMSGVAVLFDRKNFESYSGDMKVETEDGKISVAQDGKTVTVQGLLWREYSLPVEVSVKEDTNLEFDITYQDRSNHEDESIPRNLEIGPKEKVNIKGIILEGYNVNRKRQEVSKEEKRVFESIMGVGLIAIKDGKRVEKIYPLTKDAKGRQTIAVGKDYKNSTVSKILFYCNQGTANFSNARLSTPVDQKGLFALKNVITNPQDAKIAVDGIEVTRDRNEGLNDVIRGVTLNIKRAAQNEVDLQIDHNTDASFEKVKKFVDSYNKYLDYHRELTKAAKGEKPGDYIKTLSQSGFFVGDMTLLRLENTLRMTISGAYQSSADKPIKVLSQIGISTGAINAEWESIKTGRLVIDENVLKKTITENPEGVAMFFGSDTDGDNRTDNGMAYRIVYVLKPYVQIGKNIISTKIDFEDSSIKLADDNIKKKGDHLKKYEETLKRKFARMDRAISESNSKKQWMKYQMEGISTHNQIETKKEK